MFSEKQVGDKLKRYCQDIAIHRDSKKIPHKGILMFGNTKNQRCDFGVLESQSGIYVYSCESSDLFDGDILEFCGEKFLITKPQDVYFKNQIAYKKVTFEKL